MGLLYPRTISIRRTVPNATAGVQGYAGVTAANETVIASGIKCSIQQQRHIKTPDANVPSDAYNKAGFNIFIPKGSLALGAVTERDICVDDLGKRYFITGAYWNILGYNLSTELLEA